jgi:hypothetical protein
MTQTQSPMLATGAARKLAVSHREVVEMADLDKVHASIEFVLIAPAFGYRIGRFGIAAQRLH